LIERLPQNQPVNQLDPLLLQGLIAKAAAETRRPPNEAKDPQMIQRGIEAAHEMVSRKNAPTITPQMRDDAAIFIPVADETLASIEKDPARALQLKVE